MNRLGREGEKVKDEGPLERVRSVQGSVNNARSKSGIDSPGDFPLSKTKGTIMLIKKNNVGQTRGPEIHHSA